MSASASTPAPGRRSAPRPDVGLIDTSVVIDLARVVDLDELPSHPAISAVTLAELTVGPLAASDPFERAARQAVLQQAEAEFEPIPFDAAAARAFGIIAAGLRAGGRHRRARAFDTLIAATAVANALPLHTVDRSGFEGIEGLDVRLVRLEER